MTLQNEAEKKTKRNEKEAVIRGKVFFSVAIRLELEAFVLEVSLVGRKLTKWAIKGKEMGDVCTQARRVGEGHIIPTPAQHSTAQDVRLMYRVQSKTTLCVLLRRKTERSS